MWLNARVELGASQGHQKEVEQDKGVGVGLWLGGVWPLGVELWGRG